MYRFTSICSMFLALPCASAQTGPFTDGELLVRAWEPTRGLFNLYRIDPTTGVGAPLLTDIATGGLGPGWMTYDPFRRGVLAYVTHVPSGYVPRLYLIRPDGVPVSLGFDHQALTALAPVGDGRVYLRKAGVLHVLNAADQLVPVLDAAGQPVTYPIDHMVYDPATRSLVGVASEGAGTPCDAAHSITAHRLPLDPSGLRLAGPIACSSFFLNAFAYTVGLDHLAGGALLVTLTDFSTVDDQMLRLDPVSLAMSLWAESSLSDLDGGVWCQTLGRAVVLDDTNNVLRLFSKGERGSGTILPTTVPVGDSTAGGSTTNFLTDVDLYGPGGGGRVRAAAAGIPPGGIRSAADGGGPMGEAASALAAPPAGGGIAALHGRALAGLVSSVLIGTLDLLPRPLLPLPQTPGEREGPKQAEVRGR